MIMRTNPHPLSLWIAGLLAICASGAVWGQTVHTWKGAAGDWHDADQWTNGVPGMDARAIIHGGTVSLTNATEALAAFELTGGTLVFSNWTTRLIAATVTLDGGVITHTANQVTATNAAGDWIPVARVHLVCDTLTLASNAVIHVDAMGYPGRSGSGGGGYGPGRAPGATTGAGHGGYGGKDAPNNALGAAPYGSVPEPVDPGSGGGASSASVKGGDGGGVIRIDATGAVVLNGVLSANGGNGGTAYSSGGSGGSIWISAATLAGTGGVVRANGGHASGASNWAGSPGGGRIAIDYHPAAQAALGAPDIRFSVANGRSGSGAVTGFGTPGTIYLTDTALLDGARFPHAGQILMDVTEWATDTLLVSNTWVAFPAGGFRLRVTHEVIITGIDGRLDLGGNAYWRTTPGTVRHWFYNLSTDQPALTIGRNLTLTNGGSLYVYAGPTNALNPDAGALIELGGDILVADQSLIVPRSQPVNGGSPLFRVRHLTVSSNGSINANATGFRGGASGYGYGYPKGAGAWPSGWGAGGGYGGLGGADNNNLNAGQTYGASNAPIHPGSGGRGYDNSSGAGGGLVRIESSGTVRIDGAILARGQSLGGSSYSGAGSGGAIYIRCRSLTGAAGGRLDVRGGTGVGTGNSGGGGRIAIWRVHHRYAGSVDYAPGDAVAHYAGKDPPTEGTIFWGARHPWGSIFIIR